VRLEVIKVVTFFLDAIFTNLAHIPVRTFETNLLHPSSDFKPIYLTRVRFTADYMQL